MAHPLLRQVVTSAELEPDQPETEASQEVFVPSLFETLHLELDDQAIERMSRSLGIHESEARRAVSGAIPLLLSALAGRSARPGGAEALIEALDRDRRIKLAEELPESRGMDALIDSEEILHYALGRLRLVAEHHLGQMSGLSDASAGRLLSLLAPVVLGALDRVRRRQRLNPAGLAGLLNYERRQALRSVPHMQEMLAFFEDDPAAPVAGERFGAGLLERVLGRR